jgi:hypothetical protein
MAQVTELKVYCLMGGLYDRSFTGKEEEASTLAADLDPNSDDLQLIRPL